MRAFAWQLLELLHNDPEVERDELSVGRVFFCWDDDRKLNYFPLVIKEALQPRTRLIKVACLKPEASATNVCTVDTIFKGDTGDKKKDYARTSLIFNAPGITGEVWRALTALQMVDMKASPRGMW